jgi:hypothetical protein
MMRRTGELAGFATGGEQNVAFVAPPESRIHAVAPEIMRERRLISERICYQSQLRSHRHSGRCVGVWECWQTTPKCRKRLVRDPGFFNCF